MDYEGLIAISFVNRTRFYGLPSGALAMKKLVGADLSVGPDMIYRWLMEILLR